MSTVRKPAGMEYDRNSDDDEFEDDLEIDNPAEAEDEDYSPPEYSITSYGADIPVDGLVKRIDNGSIYIPSFQRSYVWNLARASRFVESLLLGLPVPAIFVSKEADNRQIVIDGQQRLKTLQMFYKGTFEPLARPFKLQGVVRRFRDKTYEDLEISDRIALDDSLIHVIIVKQEEPDEGSAPTSIYHLFERLNTGGVLLRPQEIRTAVFHGPLMDLLRRLNDNSDWRKLLGEHHSKRLRDQELILRFLALYYDGEDYEAPMKEFLNRFAARHRDLSDDSQAEFEQLFSDTVSMVVRGLGERAFRARTHVNAALADALMVGIARRLAKDRPLKQLKRLKGQCEAMLQEEEFQAAIRSETGNEVNVRKRVERATKAFHEVR